MTTIFIETDPGSGYKYAGIATTTADVDALAQQLVVQSRWEGDEPAQLPPATQATIDVAGLQLCGVLDETALLSMTIQSDIAVHELAEQARTRRWGAERIRGLVG